MNASFISVFLLFFTSTLLFLLATFAYFNRKKAAAHAIELSRLMDELTRQQIVLDNATSNFRKEIEAFHSEAQSVDAAMKNLHATLSENIEEKLSNQEAHLSKVIESWHSAFRSEMTIEMEQYFSRKTKDLQVMLDNHRNATASALRAQIGRSADGVN